MAVKPGSAKTQTGPRRRGPVLQEDDAATSASVPRRFPSGKECANTLANADAPPVRCRAGPVDRRVRCDRFTIGVAIGVLVGGDRLPRGRLQDAAVARRRYAAVHAAKLAADAGVLLAQTLVLAAKVRDRRLTGRDAPAQRADAHAVHEPGVQHVQQEQAADHRGGYDDRNPVWHGGPVPLPERDVMRAIVLRCVESDPG